MVEKEKMKERLLTSLLAVLSMAGLQAQQTAEVPRLVVGLTIDQLRTDYVEAFSALYGERGFKRLLREGRFYRQLDYGMAEVDRASAVASLYAGAPPCRHGIVGQDWIDRGTARVMNCAEDKAYMGIYTDETTSAAAMLTSTLADELKVGTQGKAWVYSIAPFRDAAVMAAGHAADGAFWLNDDTGLWCGTTYYAEFPYWVTRYNDQKGLDKRISDITWRPLHASFQYRYLASEWDQSAFKYHFENEKRNKFRRLKTSPYANDEVNRLAAECLLQTPMGEDGTPDLLSLTYYAGNYDHKTVMEAPMEMQDIYVRLDRNLADLLDLVDKKVGLQNALFVIASTGYVEADGPDLNKYRIPAGEFYPNRCAALLNMYLTAIYGPGQFVEAYKGPHIYLDHQLIEKKQLNLAEVVDKAADFLIQFSGVAEVYTAYRLLLGSWTPEVARIRDGFHRRRSGDLLIEVLPGWTVVQDNPSQTRVVRKAYVPAPLILLGGGVKASVVETPVSADCVAPTMARFMRIRAPNACPKPPLTGLGK